ncbi:MAG: hypothetical protein ABIH35_01665 [Patescibacteria group bacterium]
MDTKINSTNTHETALSMVAQMRGVDDGQRGQLHKAVLNVPENRMGEAIELISKTQQRLTSIRKNGVREVKSGINQEKEKANETSESKNISLLETQIQKS